MKSKNQTCHFFEHDGVTYRIEKDPITRGYNYKTLTKWNLDGTPRCHKGWCWSVERNGCWVEQDQWASSLANAKAAIMGEETGCAVWS
jgi:hypothetical protein